MVLWVIQRLQVNNLFFILFCDFIKWLKDSVVFQVYSALLKVLKVSIHYGWKGTFSEGEIMHRSGSAIYRRCFIFSQKRHLNSEIIIKLIFKIITVFHVE